MAIRTTEFQPGVSFHVVTSTYKPTVHVSSSVAELQVQLSQRGNIIHLAKEPEGGYYLLVADARPVSAAKTRIDLYRFPIGHAQLAEVRTCLGVRHKRHLSFRFQPHGVLTAPTAETETVWPGV